ncbi:hypothetical protein [uncultured Cohaesibacter sp.]|uniref:hypothetical protein n=1 Tax=uncultured Cohaesibacter sp. TaxID=1002546 RepID=UPI002AABA26C|nr:hypothetical protein [uncultured Cohaesibacter sp.]
MNKISPDAYSTASQNPTFLFAPAIAPTGSDLHHLMEDPASVCSFEQFLTSLTVRDITFECEGDGPLAQHPGFPGAVRQAIGSQLMKTASREALAGLPCPWGPACGFQVFFNMPQDKNGDMANRITHPWILRTETADATSVRITMRLFGLGLLWASEISDACHRAIEEGIYIGGLGPVCDSVLIRSVENVWTGLDDDQKDAERAMISFVTPFHDDASNREQSITDQFLAGLVDRAAAVARWHGVSPEGDVTKIKQTLLDCQCDDAGLTDVKWNRTVSQQRSAAIAMQGRTGLLQLRLPDQNRLEILQLLHLGELLHCGSMLAFGQGRYKLYLI